MRMKRDEETFLPWILSWQRFWMNTPPQEATYELRETRIQL